MRLSGADGDPYLIIDESPTFEKRAYLVGDSRQSSWFQCINTKIMKTCS